MKPFESKSHDPEKRIENEIRKKLAVKGWYTKKMHGNAFQSGVPDVYATHSTYGIRWIEVKTLKGRFTAAQRETFPKLSANGTPIWVLTDSTDAELEKLFGPENWYWFLKGVKK